MTVGKNEGSRRELRFALVLYGGVSLCIYMHGTTKEINRLVSASAALAADEAFGTASEQVYRELLESLAERDKVRTDISVDVIAGTSAGGINGVYLAKALACNLSQSNLRDMWLNHADLGELMWGPSFIDWRLRIPGVLARLAYKPALDGRSMAIWLHDALEAMDANGRNSSPATLMPPGASMDLMVTMTDFYGYDRQVAISSPKIVHDEQHRHVLRFSQADNAHRYDSADNLALAFAARATSCFPGAFEPVSPSSFCEWVSKPGRISDEFFRTYELSGVDDPLRTRFVDGGVLDNRPFEPAIDALRRKPAHSEIERWVLYLDPDPSPPHEHRTGLPRPLETIVGAIAGLPRKQPILDSLIEIEAMNERVREVRDVIEESFSDVRKEVEGVAPDALNAAPDPTAFQDQDDLLFAQARAQLGVGYLPYLRARVAGLIDLLADATCALCRYPPESSHAMLTHRIWLGWAEKTGLFSNAAATRDAQSELLDSLDVNFALRRVHFTLAGVNWLYEPPTDDDSSTAVTRSWPVPQERERLDRGKAQLWNAIHQLEQLLTTAFVKPTNAVRACFPEAGLTDYLNDHGLDADAWLVNRREEIDGLVTGLRGELGQHLRRLAHEIYEFVLELGDRKDLRVRYVGFALFDSHLYPIEYGAGVAESDRVDVMRLSPLECELLSWPKPKVNGCRYGHFGAFMKREWRESDYLAGRLDGAERMVSLLVGEDDPAVCRQWSRRAFAAILSEERSSLKTAAKLIDALEAQVARLQ